MVLKDSSGSYNRASEQETVLVTVLVYRESHLIMHGQGGPGWANDARGGSSTS